MIGHAVWMEAEQTDPYVNLAIEQQLMKELPPDTAALYLWQNDHTIVIGRNQDPWAECRAEAFMADGGKIARRFSGGGAVYHDLGNLNYTFLMPQKQFDMAFQMNIVLQAVASLGIPAAFNGRNDLTSGGRKFSGNAFQMKGAFSCQHGTLLVNADLSAAQKWLTADRSKLARHSVHSVASRMMNLCDVRPALSVAAVKEALRLAFSRALNHQPRRMAPSELNAHEISRTADELASRQWLFPSKRACPDQTIMASFAWGQLRIELWLKDGMIHEICLFTDSMEAQLISELEKALHHARWERRSLRGEALGKISRPLSPRQLDMVGNVLALLENACDQAVKREFVPVANQNQK